MQHEAFDNKASFVVDYHYFRNKLFIMALYRKNRIFSAIRRFVFEIGKNMARFRYENAPIILIVLLGSTCTNVIKADEYIQ